MNFGTQKTCRSGRRNRFAAAARKLGLSEDGQVYDDRDKSELQNAQEQADRLEHEEKDRATDVLTLLIEHAERDPPEKAGARNPSRLYRLMAVIKDAELAVRDPKGKSLRVDVSYYPNRLTTETADARPPAPGWDISFCAFMASWSLAGALKNRRGELVPGTGPGIVVPFNPHVTQFVPRWFKQGIQNAILEIEFPSRSA